MPDYRKKRRNKILSAPKSKDSKKNVKGNLSDIKMTPQKRVSSDKRATDMKVVRGRREQNKKRFRIWAAVVVCLIIAAVLFEAVLPAGIVSTVSNSVALIGSGYFPIELDSSDTVDVQSRGSYFYLLSSTELSAFSNSGKKLYSHPHGFEKPVLKTSDCGAALFNQGGDSFLIFNLKGLKETVTTEKKIINADFSDTGMYALATEAEGYASAVSVYSKYGKRLYEWFSAEDKVNNVVISPNRKKIAVSTFKVENGEYHSKVSVLNFKSATPEYTSDYNNRLIYKLSGEPMGRFAVVSSQGLDFIKWNKYKKTEYKNDYNIALIREATHGTVAVFNRKNDNTDTKVAVFNKKGEIKFEFNFRGIISDIRLFGGHIYCMSDTDIYLIDEHGKTVSTAACGFGGIRLAVTGNNVVLVITDNKIEKIKLEEEKSK